MKKALTVSLVAMIASVFVAWGLAGCEDASNMSLSVTPSSATLDTADPGSDAQVFVASLSDTNAVLYYPLTWSVSDAELGNIAGQGANSAVYARTNRRGTNVITVRDSGGREGIASVTQK